MKILLLVPYYLPDLGPSAPLFSMLCSGFLTRGHQVTVITTVPHYPSGKVSPSYKGKLIWHSIENGAEIIRIGLPSIERKNLVLRLSQYICYQIIATWAGRNIKYDGVFIANPALWVWLPFVYLIVLRKKPSIFSIHDVYPDVGIQLGIFRHKIIINIVAAFERYCLDHASIVRILSSSFRPAINKLGTPNNKIVLIYDWVDTNLVRPLPKVNGFSIEHDLDSKFIVLYAGNIGLSQGLDCVITAAEQLQEHKDICFVVVGDGTAREQLITQTKQYNLKNIHFIPFQPRECLPEVLACADVSLVVLKHGIGAGSLPSKTYSIFASGRPVLASVDEGCEAWNLIHQAQAGVCVPPENPTELAKAILQLKNDPALRKVLGENGRRWAERYHSPQSAAEQMEKLFYSHSTKVLAFKVNKMKRGK
jgi:colanic acid biosynthesis glycosyl transferase WcaI